MPSRVPETPIVDASNEISDAGWSFETKIFPTAELLRQPWLPELIQVTNDGYDANGGAVIFGKRLHSVAQLHEELDESGFTAVAYAAKSDKQPSDSEEIEIVGTASVKTWLNDGKWQPYANNRVESGNTNGSGQQDPLDGDFEIALVTVRPGEKYRRRGIASRLVKACEQEILRRSSLQGNEDSRRPIRMMIRVVKEVNGGFWLKKAFTPVGQKICPIGTWGSLTEFVMWAMFRELSR